MKQNPASPSPSLVPFDALKFRQMDVHEQADELAALVLQLDANEGVHLTLCAPFEAEIAQLNVQVRDLRAKIRAVHDRCQLACGQVLSERAVLESAYEQARAEMVKTCRVHGSVRRDWGMIRYTAKDKVQVVDQKHAIETLQSVAPGLLHRFVTVNDAGLEFVRFYCNPVELAADEKALPGSLPWWSGFGIRPGGFVSVLLNDRQVPADAPVSVEVQVDGGEV